MNRATASRRPAAGPGGRGRVRDGGVVEQAAASDPAGRAANGTASVGNRSTFASPVTPFTRRWRAPSPTSARLAGRARADRVARDGAATAFRARCATSTRSSPTAPFGPSVVAERQTTASSVTSRTRQQDLRSRARRVDDSDAAAACPCSIAASRSSVLFAWQLTRASRRSTRPRRRGDAASSSGAWGARGSDHLALVPGRGLRVLSATTMPGFRPPSSPTPRVQLLPVQLARARARAAVPLAPPVRPARDGGRGQVARAGLGHPRRALPRERGDRRHRAAARDGPTRDGSSSGHHGEAVFRLAPSSILQLPFVRGRLALDRLTELATASILLARSRHGPPGNPPPRRAAPRRSRRPIRQRRSERQGGEPRGPSMTPLSETPRVSCIIPAYNAESCVPDHRERPGPDPGALRDHRDG